MNSLISALLPTHAMLATAAAAVGDPFPSVPPCLCEKTPPADPIRKYVIVSDDAGHEHPLVFDRAIQHSTVVPAGMRAISAGFLTITAGRLVVWPKFESESLHLFPRPQDEGILSAFLKN